MFLDSKGLLREKIKTQVEQRKITAKECLENGECLACGCETPALFYCNKACQAPLYLEKEACYEKMK